jgi:hypothetical protein
MKISGVIEGQISITAKRISGALGGKFVTIEYVDSTGRAHSAVLGEGDVLTIDCKFVVKPPNQATSVEDALKVIKEALK